MHIYLKGNGNKKFIVLFERDCKTVYGSLLQNFYICLLWCFHKYFIDCGYLGEILNGLSLL